MTFEAALTWIRQTYGIGAWKEWEKPRAPGRPSVPEEYKRAQVRYYKWVYRLWTPLLVAVLLMALIEGITGSATFGEVAAVPVGLLAVAALGHSLVNGPRYFWQKRKAGFRMAPWGEVARRSRSQARNDRAERSVR